MRTGPSPDDPHDIVYFKPHAGDDPEQAEPGLDALRSWPPSVRAKTNAVLIAVATAPPKRFAGGRYWEAMKGTMRGWFEVRIDGPKRHHYRLFCLLDYEAKGHDKGLLVVVDGHDKPFRTTLSDADYAAVRTLGHEYCNRNPRSIV
ncbi:hypothetical protein FO059_09435 [Tomitella fengzijianii]|uniref:Uncharacterized protein n=1 Tax=Tomitella fengzijianii TaxID=2597660 RepID=A0A516X823_9ACTN|nr:hypothetical protein FO059_09435 [Tomitella fengzijianii]